jgi:RNA polymerase sigma factor (sigma-70 family)
MLPPRRGPIVTLGRFPTMNDEMSEEFWNRPGPESISFVMSDAVLPIEEMSMPVISTVRPGIDDLYREHFERMVRLAHVLVDTQEDAEEVVQDAFAALLPHYERIENPLAYLRGSVLNGARHQLRRRRVARRHPAPQAEEAALHYNHIIDAVRNLPRRQRSVIVLRYELQLSDAEIGEALRIPIGTVKSTMHRALARLRTEVEQ